MIFQHLPTVTTTSENQQNNINKLINTIYFHYALQEQKTQIISSKFNMYDTMRTSYWETKTVSFENCCAGMKILTSNRHRVARRQRFWHSGRSTPLSLKTNLQSQGDGEFRKTSAELKIGSRKSEGVELKL